MTKFVSEILNWDFITVTTEANTYSRNYITVRPQV